MLEETEQVKERRRMARHPPGRFLNWSPRPGQVFTWDTTKFAGPVRGKYFDCYLMVDIHSRFIIGASSNPISEPG